MPVTTTPPESADSYVDVSALETYAAGFGSRYARLSPTYTPEADRISPADKEAALRIATIFVDGKGRDMRNDLARWWPGRRTNGAQALVWPRTAASFTDGTAIAANTVPIQIRRAVMEAACYEATNPGTLFNLITASQSIKREKVADLEIEYVGKVDDIEKLRPTISIVEDYIAQIIRMPEVSSGAGGGSSGTTANVNFNLLDVGS